MGEYSFYGADGDPNQSDSWPYRVTGQPSYASFYRETRVTEVEFFEALDAARAEYNIREEDECGWDGVTKAPSGTDCDTHFAE